MELIKEAGVVSTKNNQNKLKQQNTLRRMNLFKSELQ